MNSKFLKIRVLKPIQLLLLVLECCWATVIILDGNSVYHATVLQNYHLSFLSALLSVSLVAVFLASRFITLTRRDLLFLSCYFIYVIVYLWLKWDYLDVETFVSMFILGVPAMYILFKNINRSGHVFELLYRIADIILLLSVVSIILWYLGSISGIFNTNSGVIIQWGSEKMVYGYWGMQYNLQYDTTFGIQFYRNSSIFCEAPMFNLWLNIALATEIFLKKKVSRIRVIILCVAILTTMSTTGIIFCILCFGLNYWNNIEKRKRKMRYVLYSTLFILIPVAIIAIQNVMELKAGTLSFAMRMQDYIAGVRVWIENPIFGCGLGNLTPLYQYSYALAGNIGYSNSVFAVLATGGIWMSVLYYVPLFAMVLIGKKANNGLFDFGICCLYLFITTIFFARFISAVLISLGLFMLLNRNVLVSEYSVKSDSKNHF
ncbi:O-antigen ligase family protein [Desulfosporosinus nitroreducens]|uniref:O-antigen ligase family protein n=1 Tax=Desulfosporosinus nitroreducens TaxID=2018668 RepID=A0ABT8QYE9_9FIRM|nr:O-antigen ligase family protein [Desulfosporosinus nitroreducens]MDO0824926.1 O-antigen ligase family protein [Desulfosporosinus nitroreducens]